MAKFKKLLLYYLTASGVLLHLFVIVAFFVALNYFVLTPRQFFIKVAEKTGIDSPLVLSLLEPEKRYRDRSMDGRIKDGRPRIVLPELSSWSGQGQSALIGQRIAAYERKGIRAPNPNCNSEDLMTLVSCWLITGDDAHARKAIAKIRNLYVETPDPAGQYGNAWVIALSYDLLSLSPSMTEQAKQIIEAKLEQALKDYLRVLDDDSASLWHGRSSLAADAWLCAVVLTVNSEQREDLVKRAQGHFLETMHALAITESWPEGYNYWINNRAFYLSLASAAYVNGLENSVFASDIKDIIERVGIWHIYATRPDNRIEGYADEGPRVDLKDETRRVIDIIAGLSGNQALADYSLYLQHLHGVESYFRGYRWGFHLFNDPEVLSPGAGGRLSDMAAWLPLQELFGASHLNHLYLRSSWDPDATFISYQAGHRFTHHGHYDAGHFSLFKAAPLAVNSSAYSAMTTENRLNYAIRTVAKNSILIQRPGEKVQPNRFFERNVSAGGQRITLPTGSAITSVEHWRDNLNQGQHLEGAELESYSAAANFAYIKSDLTPGYNNKEYDDNGGGGKADSIHRELFYLRTEDVLIVRDRVRTTDADYRTKWLLHSKQKPVMKSTQVMLGQQDDGILASSASEASIEELGATLEVKILLPEQSLTHLVGGPNYRYYVETDGDDSTLDGANFNDGAPDKSWFDPAYWRMEVFPRQQQIDTQFVLTLAPRLKGQTTPQIQRLAQAANSENIVLRINNSLIVFVAPRSTIFELDVPAGIDSLYLISEQRPSLRHPDSQPLSLLEHSAVFESSLIPSQEPIRLEVRL